MRVVYVINFGGHYEVEIMKAYEIVYILVTQLANPFQWGSVRSYLSIFIGLQRTKGNLIYLIRCYLLTPERRSRIVL